MARRTELRRLRRAKELTLTDVRMATGVPESSLSVIERGITAPTEDHGKALEAYFHKPIDQLLAEPQEAA